MRQPEYFAWKTRGQVLDTLEELSEGHPRLWIYLSCQSLVPGEAKAVTHRERRGSS
jgi:hypothetical protein